MSASECLNIKPGSHMPLMYLWRDRRYCLWHFSDEWEHVPLVTRAISELYRQHACEVELSQLCRYAGGKDWEEQCCQPLLFSYRNSIPGSTGSHVAGASSSRWEPWGFTVSGTVIGRCNLTQAKICEAMRKSLFWPPNRLNEVPEVCSNFLFNLTGQLIKQ